MLRAAPSGCESEVPGDQYKAGRRAFFFSEGSACRPLCGLCCTASDFCPLQLYLCPSADPGPDRVDGPKDPQRKRLPGVHPAASGSAQALPGVGGARARSTRPGTDGAHWQVRPGVGGACLHAQAGSPQGRGACCSRCQGQGGEWRCLTDPLHQQHPYPPPLSLPSIPPSSIVVNTQGPEVPGSRLARVCGTPGGTLVVWPLTPCLI